MFLHWMLGEGKAFHLNVLNFTYFKVLLQLLIRSLCISVLNPYLF